MFDFFNRLVQQVQVRTKIAIFAQPESVEQV